MKKTKRLKQINYKTEEQQEIVRFIVILAVVIALIIGVYLFTKYIVKKPKVNLAETSTAGEINYSNVTIGTMLNKLDSNYYVLIYDSESDNAPEYSGVASNYANIENALPIYFCDLNNSLNKDYIATDKTNPSAKSIDELALGDLTLIKVTNGKISKYIEGLDTINKELGI